MRANTQRIYELLSKGVFLSVDSTDVELKHLYDDVEEKVPPQVPPQVHLYIS